MPVSDQTLRRSILRNPNDTAPTTNDDEAERRIRRRTLGASTVVNASTDSLIEEQEGLRNCLKIYHDNKICKENAWSLTLIDNVSKLVNNHHRTLKNFQIVGSTLDATSKIYGLRVDSVHRDVVRMSSGLGRLKNDTSMHNDGNDNLTNDDTAEQNANNDGSEQPKAPVKRKRARKQVSTVTKNKETLNAKLDTIPLPDPLFSKLNSIMGDVSSSNRLLLNILQTERSNLKLTLDDQFWDVNEYEGNDYLANNEYEYDVKDIICMRKAININSKQKLRQQLSGYLITNTPIDDDDEEAPPVTNTSFNQSQIDYAFDINADVEPAPVSENQYVIDYDMDDDGAAGGNDFNDDDRVAINACKGLRRPTTIIADLRPADTTQLEYSYRPLDNINQFWAGPSYWKFRKSRKITLGKESTVSTVVNNAAQAGPKRKTSRKVEMISFTDVNNDLNNFNEEMSNEDANIFLSAESKAAQKWKKSNLYKRFDSKKLKLPTDLRIDRNLFGYHTFSPGIDIRTADPSATPQIQTSGYNYDNPEDREYCSNVQVDEMDRDDTDQELEKESTVPDENIPNVEEMVEPKNDTVNEIGTNFEGAPEQIQKIDIQFAKRAKVIDMKQMKTCCLTSINKQCEKTATRIFVHPKTARPDERYQEGAASFGIIYSNLPHLLSKIMAENLSPSVAFYSILHLANEHRLRLYKTSKVDETNVFLIRRLSSE